MSTSAPRQITWWVALIIGLLGIVANFAVIPVLSANSFWLVTLGFVILAVATMVDGV
jgi:hypothetical protein